MSDPRDLTGVWYGRYVSRRGYQDNGFIAVLEEAGGVVSGVITEPDGDGGGAIRRATVDGQRSGAQFAFVKQYDGSGGWTHAVRYSGVVDAKGEEANGSWIVDRVQGSFTMQREKFDAEALEDEESADLDLEVERMCHAVAPVRR